MTKQLFASHRYFQPLLLLAVLLILCAGLAVYSPVFMTARNWLNILNNHMSHQLILAVGMTFVICTGGIDLSSSSILALSGIVLAMLTSYGAPLPLAVAGALGAAALMGAANGALVSFFTINPLIITLGTAALFRGLSIIITGGVPIYGLPAAFQKLASGGWPLPYPILISAAVLVIGAVLLSCTKWGAYMMSIGANSAALARLGVSVGAYKASAYMLNGLLAGVAMLIITARLNTAEPTAGAGMEMSAIAAVIMGGTLLSGGKGSILGTFIACLLLSVIKNGLTLLSIDAQYQEFIIGALLLSAVIATELKERWNR